MKPRFVLLFALAAVVAVGGVSPAGAETPAAEATEQRQAEPAAVRLAPALGVAGMLAAIDPETGELREPTPEEMAALTAQLEQSFATQSFEPREMTLESGGVAVELGGALQKFAAVRVEADGTLAHHCIQGHDAASEFVATAAAEEE